MEITIDTGELLMRSLDDRAYGLYLHWPDLREWLNADRKSLAFLESLRATAREWELTGRDDDLLIYRGARLHAAEAYLAQHQQDITEIEQRYIAACMKQAKDEQPHKYLDRVGWAIVVNALDDPGVIKALWPLIDLRMRQMHFSRRDFDFRDGENCYTAPGIACYARLERLWKC